MNLFYIVFTIFCAVCLYGAWHAYRILRYIREQHPNVYEEFKFPTKPFWTLKNFEAEDESAWKTFQTYLKSGRAKTLNDPVLDNMLFVLKMLNRTGFVLFPIVGALMVWYEWLGHK